MGNQDDYNEDSVPSEATVIVESDVLERVRAEVTNRQRAFLVAIAGPQTGKMFKLDRNEIIVGRSPKADLHVQDVGVSRRHAKFFHSLDTVFIDDMGSANGTFVNGEQVVAETPLADGDKINLGSTIILKFTYHDKLEEDFQNKMFEDALRDGLTKCYNKKYFVNQLHTELSYAVRHAQSLSLIIFDVDHFKHVNDTYGHLAGDYILTRLALVGMESVRTEDTFARYGGEEFAIICRGVDSKKANVLAERIRTDIERCIFEFDDIRIPITVSLGVASYPELEVTTQKQLIAAADGALYKAKSNGRNRTEIAVI